MPVERDGPAERDREIDEFQGEKDRLQAEMEQLDQEIREMELKESGNVAKDQTEEGVDAGEKAPEE